MGPKRKLDSSTGGDTEARKFLTLDMKEKTSEQEDEIREGEVVIVTTGETK